MRILLIDDNEETHSRLEGISRAEGYHLCQARAAVEGERRATHEPFDAVILGTEPPAHLGIDLCRRLRASQFCTPLVVLSSDADTAAHVRIWEAGADALFSRAFDSREFITRLRRCLPGAGAERPSLLRFSDVEMDLRARQVTRGGRMVDLSRQEFVLLEAFMRRPQEVLSAYELGERVWNLNHGDVRKLVKAYVWRLRQQIDKHADSKLLHTVRGFGYMLSNDQFNGTPDIAECGVADGQAALLH